MTRRDRRALILGAAVLTLAVMVRGLPLASGTVAHLRGDVANKAILVARMHGDVRSLKRLSDSATLVRRQFVSLAPRLLTGGTESEAVADLALRLGALAAGHHAALTQAIPVIDSTRIGWLRRVTVRAVLESDLEGALTTFNAAEHGTVVLGLRSVKLTALNPASTDGAPEVMTAEATVSGWFLVRKGDR